MSENNSTNEKIDEVIIKTQKPIYTQEERERFVRAFIDAWNTHLTYIDHTRFPQQPLRTIDFSEIMKERPKPSVANIKSSTELRNFIEAKIKIVSGSTSAPPEIIYQTINSLFNDIVEMQGRHYLYGSFNFTSNAVEDRIFEKCKKVIDEHVKRMRHEAGLDDV